jgi:type II secretory pathway pseudopilin PulG
LGSGFGLLEILIVLVILGLMSFVVIPSIGRIFQTELRSSVRKLASVAQGVFNEAVLTKKLHRLAIDIDENKYWVEISLTEGEVFVRDDQAESEEDEAYQTFQNSFGKLNTREYREEKLPTGVIIRDVVNETLSETPFTGGVAHIYFYPFGEVDASLIHVFEERPDGVGYTIELLPISGATRLYAGYTGYEGEEVTQDVNPQP